MKVRIFSFILFTLVALVVNANIPAGYYNKAVGKKNAELKTAMCEIIKPHKRIDYGSSGTWVVFRTSDVRADGSIWDMYSNIVRYFPETGSHPEMHIEHSVPKSWWGEESTFVYDASFDLHHLVPSDASTNMSKSNRMLGIVDESVDKPTLDNGMSKTGKAMIDGVVYPVFEPNDEYKGDFARMYMYVITCYQDYTWQSNGVNMFNTEVYPTLNSYARNLLMAWHRQDPVSAKEINRNEAVYNAQDNRNPFIDFPILAEYLWGDSVDRTFVLPTIETPYLLTPSQGEKIDMGTVMAGTTVEYNLAIEAENLAADISLSWKQNIGIELSHNRLSAQQSIDGTEVVLSYRNTDYVGELRDTLVISGGGLLRNVELPVMLQTTTSFIPLTPTDVTSTEATLRWVAMPQAQAYRVNLYEGATEATDLFISAYVEGSSYNKAIALYNGTKHTVNTADYALGIQRNGEGAFVNYWQLPAASVGSGETFIIVSSSCDEASDLRGYADAFIPSLETSPLNFNGNDALALYHNHILIDVVGEMGIVENWGKDITLYRSHTTLGPTTEYNASQWVQAPKDDFSQLRSFVMEGVTATPNIVLEEEVAGTHLKVEGLVPYTVYTYHVVALLSGREQEVIYNCAFTTDMLAMPVDLRVDDVSHNRIECSWGEVLGAEAYEINCITMQGTGPTTVSEGFENVDSNGKPLPDGWQGNASGHYTSDASSGVTAPSVALKNTGEYIETPEYIAPVTAMSFMYRFASAATGSSFSVEYKKNDTWQLLERIDYVNTTKTVLNYTFDVADNVRAFRYTYSKNKGNLAIDDVAVTYGALDTVYVVRERRLVEPVAILENLRGNTSYALFVRAVLGGNQSPWSEAIVVKTDNYPSTVQGSELCDVQWTLDGNSLVLHNLPEGSHVLLYDVKGILCSSAVAKSTATSVNIEHSGVYFVKIVNKNDISVLKFVSY